MKLGVVSLAKLQALFLDEPIPHPAIPSIAAGPSLAKSIRLSPAQPADPFASPQAYTDWTIQQTLTSKKQTAQWQNKLQSKRKISEETRATLKNQHKLGQHITDVARQRAERAISAELYSVYPVGSIDRKQVIALSSQIAKRHAAHPQVQNWVKEALNHVLEDAPLRRNTFIQLHKLDLAYDEWLAARTKQRETQKKHTVAGSLDSYVQSLSTELRQTKQQLLASVSQELNNKISKIQGKHSREETRIEAARLIADRYPDNAQLASALQADLILNKAWEAGKVDQRIKLLGEQLPPQLDPNIRDLVLSDARGITMMRDYTAWGLKQIDRYQGPDKVVEKLRQLTDPHRTDPLQAQLLVEHAMPLLREAAHDFSDETQRVADEQKMFLDFSATMDSARRASASNALNAMTGQTAPKWFMELAGTLSRKPDISDFIAFSVEKGGGSLIPLEIAKQLAAHGNRETAQGIIKAVCAGHDILEASLLKPISEYEELGSQITEPMREWKGVLTEERQKLAQEAWRKQPPAITQQIDAKRQTIKADKLGYDYLRSLQGLAAYEDQNAFHTLLEKKNKNPLEENIKQFLHSPHLQFGTAMPQSTNAEVLRLYQDEVHAMQGLHVNSPSAAADAKKEMSFGEAAGKGVIYGSVAAINAILVLSKVDHNVGFTPLVLPIAAEQAIRSMFLYAGLHGAFNHLVDTKDNKLLSYLVNAGGALTAAALTVPLWNKGLGENRIPGIQFQNPERFKFPGTQIVLVFALPITVNLVNQFIDQPNPSGYHSHFERMVGAWPLVLNLAGHSALSSSLAGAYTSGGAILHLVPEGKLRAPLILNMRKSGNIGQVIAAGFRAAGWGPSLINATKIFMLVGLNVQFTEAIFANQIQMPAGVYSLQNSEAGQIANVAMPAGSVAGTIGWMLAGTRFGNFLGPVGWVVSGLSAVSSLAFSMSDKARAASYLEGPTREWLTAAGYEPGFADLLADYDGEGVSASSRLIQLAKSRHENPSALIEHLAQVYRFFPNGKKRVRDFITASHGVLPNDKGTYPQDAANDIQFWPVRSFYYWPHTDAKARDLEEKMRTSLGKPHVEDRIKYMDTDTDIPRPVSIAGLDLYSRVYLPSREELFPYMPKKK